MGKRKRPGREVSGSPIHSRVLIGDEISVTREAGYIVGRAQSGDARAVTLGRLVLFSTGTGDAWMLDAEDSLTLCLARAGERQSFQILETPTSYTIAWEADFRIDGDSFVVLYKTGRAVSILGYPTQHLLQAIRRAR